MKPLVADFLAEYPEQKIDKPYDSKEITCPALDSDPDFVLPDVAKSAQAKATCPETVTLVRVQQNRRLGIAINFNDIQELKKFKSSVKARQADSISVYASICGQPVTIQDGQESNYLITDKGYFLIDRVYRESTSWPILVSKISTSNNLADDVNGVAQKGTIYVHIFAAKSCKNKGNQVSVSGHQKQKVLKPILESRGKDSIGQVSITLGEAELDEDWEDDTTSTELYHIGSARFILVDDAGAFLQLHRRRVMSHPRQRVTTVTDLDPVEGETEQIPQPVPQVQVQSPQLIVVDQDQPAPQPPIVHRSCYNWSINTVANWVESLDPKFKVFNYGEKMRTAEIDGVGLEVLTREDLGSMGIEILGHQLKIIGLRDAL